jgi:hypothetical protein
VQTTPYVDATAPRKPKRAVGSNLGKHSKVIAPGSQPACPLLGADNWRTKTSEAGAAADFSASSLPAVPSPSSSLPGVGTPLDLSGLSYAEQHATIARAVLGDKSGRFHSSIQKLAALGKQHRRRRRAVSPDELDAEEQRTQAAVAAAVEAQNNEQSTDTAAAATEADAAEQASIASGDVSAFSAPAASSHVLSKQARLDALDAHGGALFPSDRFVSGPSTSAVRTRVGVSRATVVWLCFLAVLCALVGVTLVYRRQRRAQSEAEGKHSPHNTPTASTRALLVTSPTNAGRAMAL